MTTELKEFNELTLDELYQLLQLRSAIFVVEQDCIYQDIDGKDQKAWHLLLKDGKELIAYTRIFKPGDYFKNPSIGRVLVREDRRKEKWGHAIIKASKEAILSSFPDAVIEISAQTYLQKFYESHGFSQIGESYLEDGIPHIRMVTN
ncbi:GNAT family N-acetyltransferase [Robertkochia aurantiaca]|uniref:GNAT family N-acetyltransferase n=1 Tax=Robertkochia aurantiaca TaxID=2873700 RepID=UPI001CCA0C0E|nr:GNAT family N-acetyltransferase [Robertkochia sp. 3YJGBD-33]